MVLAQEPATAVSERLRVERARLGDTAAFAELMREHQGVVERVVLGFVRDRDDASDIAQETWIKAARNLPSLRDSDRFRPWVCRIARNTSLSFLDTRHRRERDASVAIDDEVEIAGDDRESPERHVLALDERRKVWEVLGELSERDRTALYLREVQGMSYQEISGRLGISRGAAEVCVFRARERFRKHFVAVEASDAEHAGCSFSPLQLSALLESDTDPVTREELLSHLSTCEACTERYQSMEAGSALYRRLGLFLPLGGPTAGGLLAKVQALAVKLAGLLGGGGTAGSTAAATGVGATAASASGAGGAAAIATPISLAVPGKLLGTAVSLVVAATVSPAVQGNAASLLTEAEPSPPAALAAAVPPVEADDPLVVDAGPRTAAPQPSSLDAGGTPPAPPEDEPAPQQPGPRVARPEAAAPAGGGATRLPPAGDEHRVPAAPRSEASGPRQGPAPGPGGRVPIADTSPTAAEPVSAAPEPLASGADRPDAEPGEPARAEASAHSAGARADDTPASNAPGQQRREAVQAEKTARPDDTPAADAPGQQRREAAQAEKPARPDGAPAADAPSQQRREAAQAEKTARPDDTPAADAPGQQRREAAQAEKPARSDGTPAADAPGQQRREGAQAEKPARSDGTPAADAPGQQRDDAVQGHEPAEAAGIDSPGETDRKPAAGGRPGSSRRDGIADRDTSPDRTPAHRAAEKPRRGAAAGR